MEYKEAVVGSDESVLEDLKEGFVIEVGPVVDLKLFVEGLDLLPHLVLRGGVDKLVFRGADIGCVQYENDLGLSPSIRGGVLELEDSVSK